MNPVLSLSLALYILPESPKGGTSSLSSAPTLSTSPGWTHVEKQRLSSTHGCSDADHGPWGDSDEDVGVHVSGAARPGLRSDTRTHTCVHPHVMLTCTDTSHRLRWTVQGAKDADSGTFVGAVTPKYYHAKHLPACLCVMEQSETHQCLCVVHVGLFSRREAHLRTVARSDSRA